MNVPGITSSLLVHCRSLDSQVGGIGQSGTHVSFSHFSPLLQTTKSTHSPHELVPLQDWMPFLQTVTPSGAQAWVWLARQIWHEFPTQALRSLPVQWLSFKHSTQPAVPAHCCPSGQSLALPQIHRLSWLHFLVGLVVLWQCSSFKHDTHLPLFCSCKHRSGHCSQPGMETATSPPQPTATKNNIPPNPNNIRNQETTCDLFIIHTPTVTGKTNSLGKQYLLFTALQS